MDGFPGKVLNLLEIHNYHYLPVIKRLYIYFVLISKERHPKQDILNLN